MARELAAARAKRLLAMVHLLNDQGRVPLSRIASTLGVTVPEVVNDLDLLMCCGVSPYAPDDLVPVYVEDGTAIIWSQLPALQQAPRLSLKEARAVVAALGIAGIEPDDPLIVRLLASAGQNDSSAEAIARALRAAGPAGEPTLGIVARATSERRVLRIRHQGAESDRPIERVVEPLALVNEGGVWYLETYCRYAEGRRTFRLDRIRSAEMLDERVPAREISPTGTALATDDLPVARILLTDSTEVSERDWPGMRVLESSSDTTLVEVPYAGTRWIARQVVARLGQAQVLDPAEVREAVRALAADIAAGTTG